MIHILCQRLSHSNSSSISALVPLLGMMKLSMETSKSFPSASFLLNKILFSMNSVSVLSYLSLFCTLAISLSLFSYLLTHMLSLPIVDKDESLASEWRASELKLRNLEKDAKRAEVAFQGATDIATIVCEIVSDQVALGAPNPAEIICWVVLLALTLADLITSLVLDATVTAFQHSYQDATIGDAQVYDGYIASTDTLDNLKIFMDWTVDALGITNQNGIQQHTAMRNELVSIRFSLFHVHYDVHKLTLIASSFTARAS